MDSLVFGVGCLHIETLPVATDKGDIWEQRAEKVLSAIPSVSNLQMPRPTPLGEFFGHESEFYAAPFPNEGILSFDLHIPKRLQEAIPYAHETNTEDFRIITNYNHSHPVTFVVSLGADPEKTYGSNAVVVVREFLEKEIERQVRTSGRAFLSTLGPSPFHANFTLSPLNPEFDSGEVGIVAKWEPRAGYDEIGLHYDASYYESAQHALLAASSLMSGELGLFYTAIRRSSQRLLTINEIRQSTDALIGLHSASDFQSRCRRIFKSSKIARNLRLEIANAELSFSTEIRWTKDSIRSICDGAHVPLFRPWIERECVDDYVVSLASLTRMIELLEARQTRDFNTLLVVVTAVLGGVVGALATSLLTGP